MYIYIHAYTVIHINIYVHIDLEQRGGWPRACWMPPPPRTLPVQGYLAHKKQPVQGCLAHKKLLYKKHHLPVCCLCS